MGRRPPPPAVFLGLIPALLGVAAVAPDTGSGGTAFLSRLPLSTGRALATKVAAAWLWAALAVTAYVACVLVRLSVTGLGPTGEGAAPLLFMLVSISSFGFGAGLMASVMAHQTMPALLLAPCLAVLTAMGALALPVALLEMSATPALMGFAYVALGGYAAAFVVLAFLAYVKGNRHLRTSRPAGLALGGLLTTFLLGLGATAAAHAWTVEAVLPELTVHYGAVGGEHVLAVQLGGPAWPGWQQRVAVIDRETQDPWVVPVLDAGRPQLSPSGAQLVLWDHSEPLSGWLVDLETREVEAFRGMGLRPGVTSALHPLWLKGRLRLLDVRGERVRVYDPIREGKSLELTLPSGSRFLGADPQGRVLAWSPRGVHRVSLGGAGTETLAFPEGLELAQVVLSPSGRHILAQPTQLDAGLVVWELGSERALRLPSLRERVASKETAAARERRTRELSLVDYRSALQALGAHVFGFSPGDRRLLVELPGGEAALVDLERKRVATFAPERRSPLGLAVAWSPDGLLATLPSGLTVDALTARIVGRTPVAAYLTPELALQPGQPLLQFASAPAPSATAKKGGPQ